MTSGYLACSFDLLNVRDLDVIAQAKELCDRLTVGVFDDECALQVRGRSPVVPLQERLTLVSHLRDVDEVVIHHADQAGLPSEIQIHFVVNDEQPPGIPREAIFLDAARRTASWMLIEALRVSRDAAVA